MKYKAIFSDFDGTLLSDDFTVSKKNIEALNEYVDKGATCLLSTHVLSEVDKYCKNAAIMRDGRLTMLDTPHIDDETFLSFYEDDEEAKI